MLSGRLHGQTDTLERYTLNLRCRERSHARLAIARKELVAESWTRTTSTTPPLPRGRASHPCLLQPCHVRRWVVACLLHPAAVNDVDDIINGDGSLRIVSRRRGERREKTTSATLVAAMTFHLLV